jgi:hypothetical protein
MREEAPREQQDRRAYTSGEIHGGLRWFYRHAREAGGAKDRHKGETWGETSFRDSKACHPRGLSPAAESLRDGSASSPAFRGSSQMSANPKSMYTRHDKYPM